MQNIIVNKIMKYVILEDQLRGQLKKQKNAGDFSSLTEKEKFDLAKLIIKEASPSDLDEYTLESAWRTSSDTKGKSLGVDDTDPNFHLELIDTDESDLHPKQVWLDNSVHLKCESCGLSFYVDSSVKNEALKCPRDGGAVKSVDQHLKKVQSDREASGDE